MNSDFRCITCDSMPDVDFSICAPQLHLAQISDIYLTKPGHGFYLDETNATEWAYRLALTSADPSRIINLKGIGNKNEAVLVSNTGAYARVDSSNKLHVLDFVIQELTSDNYEMMRYFEKFKKAICWYATSGGKMFGGKNGIQCEVNFNSLIPESANDIEKIKGTISFYSEFHPHRNDAVI